MRLFAYIQTNDQGRGMKCKRRHDLLSTQSYACYLSIVQDAMLDWHGEAFAVDVTSCRRI
jgi:hypothetical protein